MLSFYQTFVLFCLYRTGRGGCVSDVLVVSSRPRVHGLLSHVVRLRNCRMFRTTSYRSALGRLGLRGPRIILYSIFLPSNGKISVIAAVGGLCPRLRIVLLATRNGVPSNIRTVGGKTFSCVAGKSSGGGVVPLVDQTVTRTGGGMKRGIGARRARDFSFSTVGKGSRNVRRTMTLTQGISTASIAILLAKRANAKGRIFTRTVRHGDLHGRGTFITMGYSTFDGSLLRDRVFNRGTNSFAKTVGSGGKLFRITSGKAVFLSRVNRVTFRLRTGLLHILRTKRCVGVNSAGPAGIGIHIVSTAGQSLGGRVRRNGFHRSLCCHLSIFRVRLPPLHRHGRSVRLLTRDFVRLFSGGLKGRIRKVTPRFLGTLGTTS